MQVAQSGGGVQAQAIVVEIGFWAEPNMMTPFLMRAALGAAWARDRIGQSRAHAFLLHGHGDLGSGGQILERRLAGVDHDALDLAVERVGRGVVV